MFSAEVDRRLSFPAQGIAFPRNPRGNTGDPQLKAKLQGTSTRFVR